MDRLLARGINGRLYDGGQLGVFTVDTGSTVWDSLASVSSSSAGVFSAVGEKRFCLLKPPSDVHVTLIVSGVCLLLRKQNVEKLTG